jgi:putative nucleotidyltransferase with HDIG domain
MSQSAQLATGHGCDDEVVLAAFFHDIGHLCGDRETENSMDGYGIKRHEKIGADFLRAKGFPERVARLVENHVQAKRYLTWRDPEYYSSLSEASKKTLSFQGGIMSAEEADAFQNDPLFEASIVLRKWDELAKEVNIPLMDLSAMKAVAKKVLQSAR